jgi:hypothetical protein
MGDSDSALWEPEHYDPGGPSEWFVSARVPGIHRWDWDKAGYWSWIRHHCQGSVRCYSLDGSGQGWWGFEHRDDIVLWSLRWVG